MLSCACLVVSCVPVLGKAVRTIVVGLSCPACQQICCLTISELRHMLSCAFLVVSCVREGCEDNSGRAVMPCLPALLLSHYLRALVGNVICILTVL